MAYDVGKLAKLEALKAQAERIKAELALKASKTEVSALKTDVDALKEAGGEPNAIESIKVNGTAQAVTDKAVNITVPTKVSALTNDAKYQTEAQVNAKISAVYKPGGSVAFASLPTASAANVGMVYNVTDAFTTNANFIEGAGQAYPKGTNVVVVLSDSAYKYDVLSGFVDLSGKVDKVSGKGLSTNDYTTAEKQKLAGLSNYTHPAYAEKESGLYKVTVDAKGHVSAATPVAKADITALGIPGTNTTYSNMGAATASAAGKAGLVPAPAAGKQTAFLRGDGTWVVPTNTTYSNATTGTAGLMSAADKTKLDGFEVATDAEVAEMLTEVFG